MIETGIRQGDNMFRQIAIAWVFAASITPVSATVIDGQIIRQNGNGQFVKLETTKPFNVGNDSFDTDNLYAFDEDQNITLQAPIRVDYGPMPEIPAGRVIASHYVFFDSLAGTHLGYVDFDAEILGIAAFQDTMAATDFLANTGVTYISMELRGLENGDRVGIDPQDPQRLWVFWAGSSPGDYIRVFTARSEGAAMM